MMTKRARFIMEDDEIWDDSSRPISYYDGVGDFFADPAGDGRLSPEGKLEQKMIEYYEEDPEDHVKLYQIQRKRIYILQTFQENGFDLDATITELTEPTDSGTADFLRDLLEQLVIPNLTQIYCPNGVKERPTPREMVIDEYLNLVKSAGMFMDNLEASQELLVNLISIYATEGFDRSATVAQFLSEIPLEFQNGGLRSNYYNLLFDLDKIIRLYKEVGISQMGSPRVELFHLILKYLAKRGIPRLELETKANSLCQFWIEAPDGLINQEYLSRMCSGQGDAQLPINLVLNLLQKIKGKEEDSADGNEKPPCLLDEIVLSSTRVDNQTHWSEYLRQRLGSQGIMIPTKDAPKWYRLAQYPSRYRDSSVNQKFPPVQRVIVQRNDPRSLALQLAQLNKGYNLRSRPMILGRNNLGQLVRISQAPTA